MTYVSLKAEAEAEEGRRDYHRSGLVFVRFLSNLWVSYCLWRERVLDRQRLSELDDHILSDIGLTPWQVNRETEKPFWRPVDPRR